MEKPYFENESARLSDDFGRRVSKAVYREFFNNYIPSGYAGIIQPGLLEWAIDNLVHSQDSNEFFKQVLCIVLRFTNPIKEILFKIHAKHNPAKCDVENSLFWKEYLLLSALTGRIDEALSDFKELHADLQKEILNNYLFPSIENAIISGSLDAVEQLLKYVNPDLFSALFKASGQYEYSLFTLATIHGRQDILLKLEEKHPDILGKMLIGQNYFAVREVIKNNYEVTALYLLKKLPKLGKLTRENIFSSACWSGNIKIVNKVFDFFTDIEKTALVKKTSEGSLLYFINACQAGNFDLAKWFYQKADFQQKSTMLCVKNFDALYKAVFYNHTTMALWILSRSAEALLHVYQKIYEKPASDYAVVYHQFESQFVSQLQEKSKSAPKVRFDVKEPLQINILYLLAKGIVESGNKRQNNKLKFILSLPSFRAIAHKSVFGFRRNELLQLAIEKDNPYVVRLLLDIVAVDNEAAQHSYYIDQIKTGVSEDELLNDESSMVDLSRAEDKRVQSLIDYYLKPKTLGTRFRKKVDKGLNELRNLLWHRYYQNPAVLETPNQKIILPLYYDTFEALNLNEKESALALKAYYQHPAHTALRYISIPNRWMNIEADFKVVDPENSERVWSNFEKNESLLVVMYLAARDLNPDMAPINGGTVESRIDLFIKALSLMGRAHNWDNYRLNAGQPGEIAYYDDLKPDVPTCSMGAERRLMQSVIDHPLTSQLTINKLEQALKSQVWNFFKSKFLSKSQQERYRLKNAFADFIDDPTVKQHAEPLKNLDLTTYEVNQVVNKVRKSLGSDFELDIRFELYTRNKLALKEGDICHVIKLDGLAQIYQGLFCKYCPEGNHYKAAHSPSSSGFFQSPKPQNLLDDMKSKLKLAVLAHKNFQKNGETQNDAISQCVKLLLEVSDVSNFCLKLNSLILGGKSNIQNKNFLRLVKRNIQSILDERKVAMIDGTEEEQGSSQYLIKRLKQLADSQASLDVELVINP